MNNIEGKNMSRETPQEETAIIKDCLYRFMALVGMYSDKAIENAIEDFEYEISRSDEHAKVFLKAAIIFIQEENKQEFTRPNVGIGKTAKAE
jgi:hypothetical protein